MSTDSTEPKAPNAEKGEGNKPEVVYPFGGMDPFLATHVKFINKRGYEVGITLNVGGLLITGLLASGREYYKTFGEQYAGGLRRSGVDESIAKSMQETFESMGTRFYGASSEDKGELDNEPIAFIHIKNARIYSGSQIVASVDWWRGRLAAVDGFILGEITQKQP